MSLNATMLSASETARLAVILGYTKDDRATPEFRDFKDFAGKHNDSAVIAHYLYLLLLCRYPGLKELSELSFQLKTHPLEHVFEQIKYSKECRELSAKWTLVRPSSDHLLVDVGHTLHYQANSGIQRVVRSLAKSLHGGSNKHLFFRLPPHSNRPLALNSNEIDTLINWKAPVAPGKHSLFRRIKFRIKHIIDIFSRFLKCLIAALFKGTRYENILLRLQNKLQAHLQKETLVAGPVLLLDRAKILLPELAPEVSRIDFYLSTNSFSERRLSIVVFDAIPITDPEFCLIQQAYLNYLRLLRTVDQVSCISHYVAEQIKAISQCYKRINPRPLKIEAHLLAGDFSAKPAANVQIRDPNLPITVLSVGTIEPRKNQIGLLRAAELLWQKGLLFQLQFVGNPGWMAEEWHREFNRLKANNRPVNYFESVSDQTLMNFYQKCDFTVFCSFEEGFGLPILESLHYGKACITSNHGAMQEIARKAGGCLLCDPTHIESIAEKIEILIKDPMCLEALTADAKKVKWHGWFDYAQDLYQYAMETNGSTND